MFSSAVYSQENEKTKNDWRKEKLIFHQIELPQNISKLCVLIVKKLNLKLNFKYIYIVFKKYIIRTIMCILTHFLKQNKH